jgi:hypothetical protein
MKFNFLPAYPSPWVAFGFLMLLGGYPKLPSTPIPLGVFVFLLDWKNLVKLLRTDLGKLHIFFCTNFLIFFFARLLVDPSQIDVRSISLILALFYKAFSGLYLASIFSYLLIARSDLLVFYIALQLCLIAISAFNQDVYSLLLIFQTAEATAVFEEIFGLRSIGFGVMHNEGVVLLVLMYSIYTASLARQTFYHHALGLLMYFGAFSSRLVLVLLPIWHFFRSIAVFCAIALTAAIFAVTVDVREGALSQVFEIWNYYQDNGVVGSGSTDVLSQMTAIPMELGTWVFGDGLFFTHSGFYQDTDIGFSRIVFFGGLVGLMFYVSIFFWPLFFVNRRDLSRHWFLLFFIIYVYVVSNVKGISIQSFPLLALIMWLRAKG